MDGEEMLPKKMKEDAGLVQWLIGGGGGGG
jgi:hypothetical protein